MTHTQTQDAVSCPYFCQGSVVICCCCCQHWPWCFLLLLLLCLSLLCLLLVIVIACWRSHNLVRITGESHHPDSDEGKYAGPRTHPHKHTQTQYSKSVGARVVHHSMESKSISTTSADLPEGNQPLRWTNWQNVTGKQCKLSI